MREFQTHGEIHHDNIKHGFPTRCRSWWATELDYWAITGPLTRRAQKCKTLYTLSCFPQLYQPEMLAYTHLALWKSWNTICSQSGSLHNWARGLPMLLVRLFNTVTAAWVPRHQCCVDFVAAGHSETILQAPEGICFRYHWTKFNHLTSVTGGLLCLTALSLPSAVR